MVLQEWKFGTFTRRVPRSRLVVASNPKIGVSTQKVQAVAGQGPDTFDLKHQFMKLSRWSVPHLKI
jgi:hypothetical protein